MSEGEEKLTTADKRVVIEADPLAPPSRFQLRFYAVIATLIMWFTRAWFGGRVEGIELVPTEGPYILAPVHRSNLDFALVVRCAGTRRMRYLAKDTIWKGYWGKIWTALGAIPVHRGSPDRDALKTCIGVLERGEPLVMFPEGTRQSGSTVEELFDGVAYVQSKTGVPIIPVGIGGSETAMPKGSKFPTRRTVSLLVGPALPAPDQNAAGRIDRAAVKDRTIELHRVLQELFDQAQRSAGTPN